MATINNESYLLDFIPERKEGNVDVAALLNNITNELVKIKNSSNREEDK